MSIYKRCYFIFLTGAVGYCLLEILWRGYTHPSMALVGGLCLLLIFFINKHFRNKSRVLRSLLCAAAISAVELVSGILLNLIMQLDVWDYSNHHFNIMGQICPLYCLLWFFLSYILIFGLEKFFRL